MRTLRLLFEPTLLTKNLQLFTHSLLEHMTDRCFILRRWVLLDWLFKQLWMSPLGLSFKRIEQHINQRAVCGEKPRDFEAEKREESGFSFRICKRIGHYNNCLKKKNNNPHLLTTRHGRGRPRKTTAGDDRNIVRAVKENPKTTFSDITTNLQWAGVGVSQSTAQKSLSEQK